MLVLVYINSRFTVETDHVRPLLSLETNRVVKVGRKTLTLMSGEKTVAVNSKSYWYRSRSSLAIALINL